MICLLFLDRPVWLESINYLNQNDTKIKPKHRFDSEKVKLVV